MWTTEDDIFLWKASNVCEKSWCTWHLTGKSTFLWHLPIIWSADFIFQSSSLSPQISANVLQHGFAKNLLRGPFNFAYHLWLHDVAIVRQHCHWLPGINWTQNFVSFHSEDPLFFSFEWSTIVSMPYSLTLCMLFSIAGASSTVLLAQLTLFSIWSTYFAWNSTFKNDSTALFCKNHFCLSLRRSTSVVSVIDAARSGP